MVEQKAGLAERVDTGGDDGGQHARLDVEYGKKIADGAGLPPVPFARRQPHIGPTWLDLYQRRETLENGEAVDGRRGLPDRFDDRSARARS